MVSFQNLGATLGPQKCFLEPKSQQSGNAKLNLSAACPSKLLAHDKYSKVTATQLRDK